jgi:hypothetical protein
VEAGGKPKEEGKRWPDGGEELKKKDKEGVTGHVSNPVKMQIGLVHYDWAFCHKLFGAKRAVRLVGLFL